MIAGIFLIHSDFLYDPSPVRELLPKETYIRVILPPEISIAGRLLRIESDDRHCLPVPVL